MRDEEAFIAVFAICAGIGGWLAWTWMSNRAEIRTKRLEVMERALQSDIPDHERREVLDVLHKELGKDRKEGPGFYERLKGANRAFLFVIGWLGIFVGAGMMMMQDRQIFEAGVIVCCAGLGVATLPLALRELQLR